MPAAGLEKVRLNRSGVELSYSDGTSRRLGGEDRMSVTQVARFLNWTPARVYRAIEGGTLKARKLRGQVVVLVADARRLKRVGPGNGSGGRIPPRMPRPAARSMDS